MATKIPIPKLGQSEETVTIQSWKVKEGDVIKKGDVLATFDTSSLNSVLAEKQQAYLTAVENYNNAKNTAVKTAHKSRMMPSYNPTLFISHLFSETFRLYKADTSRIRGICRTRRNGYVFRRRKADSDLAVFDVS